jgi:hypothetical protein
LLLCAACGSGGGKNGPLSRAEFVEACERLIACRPGFSAVATATSCASVDAATLAALPASFRDGARCAADKAGDCAAILACYNNDDPTGGCDPLASTPYCDADMRFWSCMSTVAFSRDCAADGLTCVQPAPGSADCGRACVAGDGATCDGSRLFVCDDATLIAREQACGAGAACGPVGTSSGCVGTGVPCAGTATSCRDSRTLVVCLNGNEAVIDCGEGGFERECFDPGPAVGPPSCVGVAADECDPAAFADRCNGARLEYCEDGVVRGLDCRGLGFEGCALADEMLGLPAR